MDSILAEPRPAPAPAISEREKRMIIGGVLLTMLLAALEQTIVAPAMTTIAAALGRAEYLPWIVTAYLLAAIAMAPLYGKLSDIYGRRRVIFAGVSIFMVGSVICAMAPNMFVLIAARAVQGLGGGGLLALTQIVIGDLVPPAERARYASWTSGTWAIACIAGPILGGIFAEHLHWSLIFWINIPLGLFALAITSAPLKKLPMVKRPHSLDWAGAGLLVGATTALLLALNWGGHEYPWLAWEILAILAVSVALWIAFGWRLLRAEEPFISLQILSNRIVLTAAFANLMLQGVLLGLSVFVPVYLQMQVGLTATQSSLGLLGMLMGTFAGSTLSGRLIPKMTHYRAIAVFGCLVGGVALFVLAAQVDGASFVFALGLLVCAGFGVGTGFPVGTVAVQNAVDYAHLGVATGVLTFLRSLGAALGVALLGAVASSYGLRIGEAGVTAYGGTVFAKPFAAVFMSCGVIMIIGLVGFLLMPEKPLRRTQT
ncbi:MDR family MFS transporter [Roseiarcaceae bacterium H3SJ34-1]|uniref:MDR family MFS transporter n=1 Tax=Terripilifer ovatus TaxID=3032367 RepID=UPI003AB99D1E|nr:MDR family MFS transporter [Roseiarcaceae bacterium H3SJ34-1]